MIGSDARNAQLNFCLCLVVLVMMAGLVDAAAPGTDRWAVVARQGDQWDVYIVSASGEILRRATNSAEIERSAVCLPDGRIWFTVADGELREVGPDEKEGRTIVEGRNLDRLVFLPPDQVLAVEHQVLCDGRETSRLIRMNPKSGALHPALERSVPVDEPAFDEKTKTTFYRLRILGPGQQATDQIWCGFPGGEQRFVYDAGSILDRLVWSPQAQKLFFVVTNGEKPEIRAVDPTLPGRSVLVGSGLPEETRKSLAASEFRKALFASGTDWLSGRFSEIREVCPCGK